MHALRGVTGDQFLQAVTLLATQERGKRVDCRRGSILVKLWEYRKWADQVEEGFAEAAQFLNRQFISAGYNVPYNTQLVPLAGYMQSWPRS